MKNAAFHFDDAESAGSQFKGSKRPVEDRRGNRFTSIYRIVGSENLITGYLKQAAIDESAPEALLTYSSQLAYASVCRIELDLVVVAHYSKLPVGAGGYSRHRRWSIAA